MSILACFEKFEFKFSSQSRKLRQQITLEETRIFNFNLNGEPGGWTVRRPRHRRFAHRRSPLSPITKRRDLSLLPSYVNPKHHTLNPILKLICTLLEKITQKSQGFECSLERLDHDKDEEEHTIKVPFVDVDDSTSTVVGGSCCGWHHGHQSPSLYKSFYITQHQSSTISIEHR